MNGISNSSKRFFSPKRSIKTLNQILQLAKLSESDILPTSQAIYFGDGNAHTCTENYKLLELDQTLLNCLMEGKSLRIIGADDENAVLCNENKSYDLVECETSNSLLMVEGLKFCDDIKNDTRRHISDVTTLGTFYTYLSPIHGKPKLKKLLTLLNKTAYKGPEHEFQIEPSDLYTFEELQNLIQSSPEELKTALKDLNTVTVNGKIRVLEFEYHFRVLSYMLKLIEENSWALDEIDYEETVSALEEIVPLEILNSLFDLYTEHSKCIDSHQLYRYTEKVARFFAQVLLYNAGKFNLSEFLQAWKDSVPEGMVVDESLLYGIAIVDRKAKPNVIRAFPEESLPDNVVERFGALFEAKENWTSAEIGPYIR